MKELSLYRYRRSKPYSNDKPRSLTLLTVGCSGSQSFRDTPMGRDRAGGFKVRRAARRRQRLLQAP